MKIKRSLILLVILFLFGCSPEENKVKVIEPDGTFIFDGVVRDVSTKKPLSNVKLKITAGDGSDFAFLNDLGCVVVAGGPELRCIALKHDTIYTDTLGRYHFEIKKMRNRTAYRFSSEHKNYHLLPPVGLFFNLIDKRDFYVDELYMSSTGKIKIKAISNTAGVKDSLNVRLDYPQRNFDFLFQLPYPYLTYRRYKEENGEETLDAVTYYGPYVILHWDGTSNGTPISGRDSFHIKPFETIEKVIRY